MAIRIPTFLTISFLLSNCVATKALFLVPKVPMSKNQLTQLGPISTVCRFVPGAPIQIQAVLTRLCRGIMIVTCVLFTGCVGLAETPVAWGTYRIGFTDGTQVAITAGNDFANHNGEFDMSNTVFGEYGNLAAAAPGWIRYIEDGNQEPTSANNYIWIEHPYPYCQADGVDWPGKPDNYEDWCVPCDTEPLLSHLVALGADFCNEWTKYSHVVTNSVTSNGTITAGDDFFLGAGLSEDDWVEAGQYIGVEGNVGQAGGVHLHWEVAVLDPEDPINSAGFSKDWTGGAWTYSPNLFPYMCNGYLSNQPPFVLLADQTYIAGPCDETQ